MVTYFDVDDTSDDESLTTPETEQRIQKLSAGKTYQFQVSCFLSNHRAVTEPRTDLLNMTVDLLTNWHHHHHPQHQHQQHQHQHQYLYLYILHLPSFEPAISRLEDWRLSNWANRAVFGRTPGRLSGYLFQALTAFEQFRAWLLARYAMVAMFF